MNAQRNLEYTEVTSPSDGIVGKIPYRIGSLVSPSITDPMTTVSDISSMYAYFYLTERNMLPMVKEGGTEREIVDRLPRVCLQLIDGTIYPDSGKVATISGVIDRTTGSMSVRALFPNPKHILRANSTGNIIFPNVLTDVILIPQSATTEIQDKKFVYVLQTDNTVKNTEIQVYKLDDGQNYYVTGGLKAGDKIVIEGVQALHDGAAITPITPAEKEAAYQKALEDQKSGNIKTAFQ